MSLPSLMELVVILAEQVLRCVATMEFSDSFKNSGKHIGVAVKTPT